MINSITRSFIIKVLLLTWLAMLAACDGGIFGTGGPDDPAMDMSTDITNDLDTTAPSQNVDGGASSSTQDSINAETGNTDIHNGVADAGTTDSGTTDSGFTDSGTTDSAQIDNSESTAGDTAGSSSDNSGEFSNDTATLNSSTPKLNVINATFNTINVLDNNADAIYSADGVSSLSRGPTIDLDSNETAFDIVNNNDRSNSLYRLDPLLVANATFTTLVIREFNQQHTVVSLATETSTNDSMLAKVRIVQASVWSERSDISRISALSSGANPGGVDVVFPPVQYDQPATMYIELPAGDYDIASDQANLPLTPLTFVGGNAYTLVLVGDSNTMIIISNDSEAAQ